MTILYTVIGGLFGFGILILAEMVSRNVFSISLIGTLGGFASPIFLLGGCIFGFIWGNRIKDNYEQARINREIEQDRLRRENDNG